MNLTNLITDLTRDEGLRLVAYDDATGAPIKPGVTVRGHVSIGVGRALDTNGITAAEASYLLDNDIDRVNAALYAYPWFRALNDVRQNALINMGFNLGVAGLLEFHDMIRYLSEDPPRWSLVAAAMVDSEWFRQVGARAARLAQEMLTGVKA